MYNRLVDFLDKNEVLYNEQFGFRFEHSASHATLLITDKIQKAIENKLFSCGILLDLSKAFDTVNHHILRSPRRDTQTKKFRMARLHKQ